MDYFEYVARALARTFLAGPFEVEAMVRRGAELLGQRGRWLRPLARRVCAAFPGPARPQRGVLTQFLLANERFINAVDAQHGFVMAIHIFQQRAMTPIPAAAGWKLPPIRTANDLANWLGITDGELDWLADLKHLGARSISGRLSNYHYKVLAKRFGQARLIESPKSRLKDLQRQILFQILNRIPPHNAVHGFRTGRSIKSFAAPHAGKQVVLRIDLRDFFPSISAARVSAVFCSAGYSDQVAALLTGMCTNIAPRDVWSEESVTFAAGEMQRLPWLYGRPHLPQGAPTSPALANLCAYRLDCRLSVLAASAGATYTRYADDLAFSGDEAFARCADRFQLHACAIALEEGFAVHHRKTRLMRRGVRQHLSGLVVNEHPNIRRSEFDRLKATLTNCLRHGPASQNRTSIENFRAHLLGQISFVEMINETRGEKLRRLFERIPW